MPCLFPSGRLDRVQTQVVDQRSLFASRAARTQELDRMPTRRKRERVGRKSAVAGAARVEAADHLAIHQHVEGLAAIDGALRGLEGERIGAGTEGDRLAD